MRRVAGPKLEGLNINIAVRIHRDYETLQLIRSLGGQAERGGQNEDFIRWAALPAFGKDRWRRRGREASFRHAVYDPVADQCDLLYSEPPLVPEMRAARFSLPGRGMYRSCVTLAITLGVPDGILIGKQGKGATSPGR